MSEREIEVLARTVYGEARGENDLGKLAVAWVVINRAKLYRKGVAEAALLSVHFSAWNNNRANDANQLAMMLATPDDPHYARCLIAALQAYHRLKADPTEGATHYHTHGVSPSWAKDKPYTSVGGHRFYKDID